jgi:hypothetical protein
MAHGCFGGSRALLGNLRLGIEGQSPNILPASPFLIQVHLRGSPSQRLCERDVAKCQFLKNQHNPPSLFTDAFEVKTLLAYDFIADGHVAAPYVDLLVAGFPCTSKTSLSSLSGQMKRCIRDGLGDTGLASADVLTFVTANRPRLVVLENLPSLAVVDEDGSSEVFSDTGWRPQAPPLKGVPGSAPDTEFPDVHLHTASLAGTFLHSSRGGVCGSRSVFV